MMIAISVIVTLITLPSFSEAFSSTQQYHGFAVLPPRGVWNNNKLQQKYSAIQPIVTRSSSLRMSDTTAVSTEEVDESSSSSTESVTTAATGAVTPAVTTGFWNKVKAIVPPANERQKLIPLALMFFCILFSYTILRDTKDVLMITAPKSGAEVIPFIKTYVNLPVAIVRNAIFAMYRWTPNFTDLTCVF
jgi:hypothetical protein